MIGPEWANFPPLDPEAEETRRLRQRIYLSRYGSEPVWGWDDRLVWELDAAYAEMNRLILRENGKTPED